MPSLGEKDLESKVVSQRKKEGGAKHFPKKHIPYFFIIFQISPASLLFIFVLSESQRDDVLI